MRSRGTPPVLAHVNSVVVGDWVRENGSVSIDDPYAGSLGRFYVLYIERPRLARAIGALTWGTSFREMYRSLAELRSLPRSITVLDACCGGGLVLRWLDPLIYRYVGIDSSPSMLKRARRTARRRGFANAELQLADAEDIPLPDGSTDIVLLFNALHAVLDPQSAVGEVSKPGPARRPGGRRRAGWQSPGCRSSCALT